MASHSRQHFCSEEEYHVSARYHEGICFLEIGTTGRDYSTHVTFSGSPAVLKHLVDAIIDAAKGEGIYREVMYLDA